MDGPWQTLFTFFGLLALLFVLWVATGGPERAGEPGQRDGIFGNSLSIGSGIGIRESTSNRERLEELRNEGIASPYRDLVSFSGGSPGNDLATEEYIRIRVSGRADAPINVTGWRIESLLTGAYGTIPGATSLPQAGVVNSTGPLFLPKGHTATINSGRSPLGYSFRDNMCMGYLDPRDHFTPRLSQQCPDPLDEFEDFSGITPFGPRDEKYEECRVFVRRYIDRCEITREELDERDEDIPELPLSNACIAFIESDLTYQGCLVNHLSDRDFYDDEWRVFLGSFSELWRDDNEVLRLLDQEGRVVDVWQY